MSTLLQDIRYGVRSLLRAPRFTLPAVLALALGIGATSAILSVVRGVLLEPLPYRDPERIVSIWEANAARNRTRNVIGPANFVTWKERNRSFEHLGMTGPARLNLILDGQPFELTGQAASSDVFNALGTQPLLGRTFSADEDLRDKDNVIILGHDFWQSRLGGRGDVIGSTLSANGRQRTVIGVMPPRFTIEGQKADFYVTYGWTIEQLRAAPGRGTSHAIGRLRDGVTVQQAQEEMRAMMLTLAQEEPRRNTGWSAVALPIHELTTETIRPALLVLSGAVLLVLLISCVNVANLLLARSTARQRELGVRTALGAGRGRLLRQMLTESLLLAACGGIAGLVLAFAFHNALLALVADRIPVPRLDQVRLDSVIVGCTMLLALGTGLLFGVLPAVVSTATANDSLREGGRQGNSPRARRALATLVVAEVALSLVLLTGAGLLVRSFMRLQNIDPGFRAEGLFTARVSLPAARYSTTAQATAFFQDAVARVQQLPGVRSAAAISFLPLAGPGMATSFYRADQPAPPDGQQPTTEVRPVTTNFFKTMGIPQRAGRDIAETDRADTPLVAVVSEDLARRVFPGEDALGKRLQVAIGPRGGLNVEIVGVVGNIKFASQHLLRQPDVGGPGHPAISRHLDAVGASVGSNEELPVEAYGHGIWYIKPAPGCPESYKLPWDVRPPVIDPDIVKVGAVARAERPAAPRGIADRSVPKLFVSATAAPGGVPTIGDEGSLIVSGRSFPSNAEITLRIPGMDTVAQRVPVGANGQFSITLRLPENLPFGRHTIEAAADGGRVVLTSGEFVKAYSDKR